MLCLFKLCLVIQLSNDTWLLQGSLSMDCRLSMLSKAFPCFLPVVKVVRNASRPPPSFSWSIPLLLQCLQYMQKAFNLVVHRTNHGLLLYHSGENCLQLFPCSFLVACSTRRSVTFTFTGSVEVQHSVIQRRLQPYPGV